jgi:hypothetical protein
VRYVRAKSFDSFSSILALLDPKPSHSIRNENGSLPSTAQYAFIMSAPLGQSSRPVPTEHLHLLGIDALSQSSTPVTADSGTDSDSDSEDIDDDQGSAPPPRTTIPEKIKELTQGHSLLGSTDGDDVR